MIVRTDCRFFKGDIPCQFHKKEGVHCQDCKYYQSISKRILIIKLGAVGDVIRTTPLLRKLKEAYPYSEITWLVHTPEVLPSIIDHPLRFELKNVLFLLGDKFDILYNLDKDKEACALANQINADVKKGFKLESGKCAPIDEYAKHKFLTGLFDDVNRKNKKSYVEEIFEICAFHFSGERYVLELPQTSLELPNLRKPVIGLNTGCGTRWLTRLWKEEYWVELAKKIKMEDFSALLLGGPQEDARNKRIAEKSDAEYWGTFSLGDFIHVVNKCDVVVTQVTMALHIAIGLEKKIVLMNNIFNRNEFELYGLGKIIEPAVPCLGCYKQECEKNCMELISPASVFECCKELLEVNTKCEK